MGESGVQGYQLMLSRSEEITISTFVLPQETILAASMLTTRVHFESYFLG
jgi:hypothetical protein